MEDLRNKLDEVTATIANNYKLSEAYTSEIIQNSLDAITNKEEKKDE